MKIEETNERDPSPLALAALAWTLADGARAERLLALTGLAPEDLRTGLGDRVILAAILRFLEAHEPDLIACASDLGISPAELVEARDELER
ncbi:MAG TPA: DUF3572 family protein [Allosphingosinicella sp.]|jgi:hypothetical protein